MFELGSIPATEYQAKCAALDNQRTNLKTKRAEPVLVRQRTMLATLVEDWDEMTPEERRRVVGVVFAEIHASSDGIARLLPREDWKLYIRAVLREPATLARWGYGAEDGGQARGSDNSSAPSGGAWVAPVGGLARLFSRADRERL
jgi:hypothetical protein